MADPKPANSFEVASQIADLLKGLNKAQRREALQLVASRDELRVVPMDRPIGRVGVPPPLAIAKKGAPSPANKQGAGGNPRASPANTGASAYKGDSILSNLQGERDTIVSELKTIGDSQSAETTVRKEFLLAEKNRLESLIKDRRKDIRAVKSPSK